MSPLSGIRHPNPYSLVASEGPDLSSLVMGVGGARGSLLGSLRAAPGTPEGTVRSRTWSTAGALARASGARDQPENDKSNWEPQEMDWAGVNVALASGPQSS